MRIIKYTKQFRRDYKHVKKSGQDRLLDEKLTSVLHLLINNMPLPTHNYDHALSGEWNDHRDCHIKPDLILIYRKPDEKTLELIRLGSHSKLGL